MYCKNNSKALKAANFSSENSQSSSTLALFFKDYLLLMSAQFTLHISGSVILYEKKKKKAPGGRERFLDKKKRHGS